MPSELLRKTLNYDALIGYSLLALFAIYNFRNTARNSSDLLANLVLIVGLVSLISYHYFVATKQWDEKNNKQQRKTRLLAHASISLFFLMTLLHTSGTFQYYDWFGLSAHIVLFFTVLANVSQQLGAGLLAIYFPLATIRKAKVTMVSPAESIQFLGRLLMSIYFISKLLLL